jgi:hypothetical protein
MNVALRELGSEGWELVQVVWRVTAQTCHDPVYILKRPIE